MKYISKKDFAILLGNVIDHFDTSIYLFLSPLMASCFFPNKDKLVSLILTYSLTITSIITRPLGAYLFAKIARVYEPSYALSYSLIGVGSASLAIGFLPSYQVLGVFSPIFLTVFIFCQGVCAAGENTVAKIYVMEDKDEKNALKGI